MALDIVAHLNATGINPSDDWVLKRSKAIDQLAVAFRKRSYAEDMELAEVVCTTLAKGAKPLPEELRETVFQAIRKAAPKYVPDKKADAEFGIITVLAALLAITEAPPASQLNIIGLAMALESSCGFLPKAKSTNLEKLRRGIVQAVGDFLHAQSEAGRSRDRTGPPTLTPAKAEDGLAAYSTTTMPLIQRALTRLQNNASLDREELNLLWWRLNLNSRIAGKRFSGMGAGAAAICAGIEVACELKRTQAGDYVKAVACGALPDAENEISLSQVIEDVAPLSERVMATFQDARSYIKEHPTIFPILASITTPRDGPEQASFKAAGISMDRKMPASDWCERTLVETLLLRRLDQKVAMPAPERA